MDQLIAFIIIYIIYTLFSLLQKKKREQSARQAPKAPPSVPDRAAPRPVPAPAPPVGEEEEEPELPEFLRRMLGLPPEEPPAVPSPPVAPRREIIHPEIAAEEVEVAEADTDLPPSAEGGHEEASLTEKFRKEEARQEQALVQTRLGMPPVPKTVHPTRKMLIQDLLDTHSVKKAVLLREILDKPVSMRRKQFPIAR